LKAYALHWLVGLFQKSCLLYLFLYSCIHIYIMGSGGTHFSLFRLSQVKKLYSSSFAFFRAFLMERGLLEEYGRSIGSIGSGPRLLLLLRALRPSECVERRTAGTSLHIGSESAKFTETKQKERVRRAPDISTI